MRHFSENERLLVIFKRKEEKLTVGQLAEQLHMSTSNLSRIENGVIMVSKENEKLLEERFSIDFSLGKNLLEEMEVKLEYFIKLLIFYRLFEDYSKEKLEAINNKTRNSIAFPYYILIKLFIYVVKNIEAGFVKKYIFLIDDLVPMYDRKYQKIYYITKMNYFYLQRQYVEALKLCATIENEFSEDALIDSYLFHLKANIYGCLGLHTEVIKTIKKAASLAEITNNSARLLALNITKSNCERLRGNYTLGLQYDLDNLAYAEKENVHIYDYALLRNIAWTYFLLEDYKNSIQMYKEAEKLNVDDDLCFMTALCSYRLGLRQQCDEYLLKGRKAINTGVAFPYLIDWLELTLNKKYSNKAEHKLLQCLRKYENKMHFQSRNNIYKLLIEHYVYHNEIDKAQIYNNKLNSRKFD